MAIEEREQAVEATQEVVEEVKEEATEEEYVLTIRVEGARGMFLAPRAEEEGKKGKDKGKKDKGKKDAKKPVKGKKGAVEEDEAVPVQIMRTAVIVKQFPLVALKPFPEPEEKVEGEAVSGPQETEGGIMSAVAETPEAANGTLAPEYKFEPQYVVPDRKMFLDNVCVNTLKLDIVQCFGIREQPKGYSGPPQEDCDTFGSVELDLTSFLQGATSISGWRQLTLPAAVIEAAMTARNKHDGEQEEEQPAFTVEDLSIPEVLVSVSINRPLLSEEEKAGCNIATLQVFRMDSLPNDWSDGRTGLPKGTTEAPQEEGLDFKDIFTFNYQMPLSGDVDRPLSFDSSQVLVIDHALSKEDSLEEPATEAPPPASAKGTGKRPPTSGKSTKGTAKGKGSADNTEQKDRDSELDVSVIIEHSRASFLDPDAGARLLAGVRAEQPFILELTAQRLGLDEKETEPRFTKFGKVHVDLKSLLKPGATTAEGVFKLMSNEPPVPVDEEPMTGKKPPKSGKGTAKKGHAVSERPHVPFQDTGSSLAFRLTFSKPLIPKKPKLTVASVLTEEPKVVEQPVLKADKANEALQKAIKEVAGTLMQEIRSLSQSGSQTSASVYRHLLTSGTYGDFVEKLKPLVVAVIKSRFYQSMPGSDNVETKETMVNQLVVQISQYIARALESQQKTRQAVPESQASRSLRLAYHKEQLLTVTAPTNGTATVISGAAKTVWNFRAQQVESAERVSAATQHHLDALSFVMKENPTAAAYALENNADVDAAPYCTDLAQAFYTNALFAARQADYDRMEHLLLRARRADPSHLPSRLALICLLLQLDRVEDVAALVAQTKSEASDYAQHPIVLLVIALYHQLAEEDEESWSNYLEAAKAWMAPSADESYFLGEPGTSPATRDTLSLKLLAPWCSVTENDLAQASTQGGDDLCHEHMYIVLSRLLMSYNLLPLAYRVLTDGRSRVPGEIGLQMTDQPLTTDEAGSVGGKDQLKYARALVLAEIYLRNDNPQLAKGLLTEAVELMQNAQGTAIEPTAYVNLHLAAVLGHSAMRAGNDEDAYQYYSRYLKQYRALKQPPVLDPVLVLQLTALLESRKAPEENREWFKVSQMMAGNKTHARNANAWLSVAAAALARATDEHALGEDGKQDRRDRLLDLSEQALAEAATLDDKEPLVWGSQSLLLLTRLSLGLQAQTMYETAQTQLRMEGTLAFTQAMEYGLTSPKLLDELELLLSQLGESSYAQQAAYARKAAYDRLTGAKPDEAQLKAAFAVLDDDRNGFISLQEFTSFMMVQFGFPLHFIDFLIKTVDINDDGKISYMELKKFLTEFAEES